MFSPQLFSKSSILTITITKSVKRIGYACFADCEQLKCVKFEENSTIQIFQKEAFLNSAIESIEIPKSIKKIEKGCFQSCHNLKTVIFEKDCNLESLEYDVFADTSIEEITIPRKVQTICPGCFSNCKSLKAVYFEENSELECICEQSFYQSSISSIKIPSNVQKIYKDTFLQCYNLETIEFDEDSQLTSFPYFLTKTIKSRSIPSNIEYFESNWSVNLYNLTSVFLSPKNNHLKYIDDEQKMIVLNNNSLVFACRDIKHATIPNYIQRIDHYAFSKCVDLETIDISEDSELKTIGNFAFEDCAKIEKVFIPKNIKVIGIGVFSSCANLKTVEFSQNSKLLLIQQEAFRSTSIESFSFPSSLQTLYDGWYRSKNIIKHISIPKDNSFFSCINFKNCEMVLCKSKINIDAFDVLVFISPGKRCPKIPIYIKHINSDVFCSNSNIETIEFPIDSQFTSFSSYGLMDSSIKYLMLPSHFEKCSAGLFMNCECLKSVEFLGNDVLLTEIFCFKNCDNLFLLSFPNAQKVKISKTSCILNRTNISIYINAGNKIEISEFL